MDSLTFGREMRVQRTGEFARIKSKGERLAKGCLLANWIRDGGRDDRPLRLGVVTAKSVGSAVARARARRLMREVFRLNQKRLAVPLTLVLVARQSIVGKGLADVERDFLNLMRQARLLAGE
jgi:ribonuclease P protein component